jgi:hypothetical protein
VKRKRLRRPLRVQGSWINVLVSFALITEWGNHRLAIDNLDGFARAYRCVNYSKSSRYGAWTNHFARRDKSRVFSVFSAERNYAKQFHALHGVKTMNHPSPFRNGKCLMENEICSILDCKYVVKICALRPDDWLALRRRFFHKVKWTEPVITLKLTACSGKIRLAIRRSGNRFECLSY